MARPYAGIALWFTEARRGIAIWYSKARHKKSIFGSPLHAIIKLYKQSRSFASVQMLHTHMHTPYPVQKTRPPVAASFRSAVKKQRPQEPIEAKEKTIQ